MAQVRRTGAGFRRVHAAVKELNGVEGRVGYFETAKYPDGTSIALVAAVHELGYGPGGIPPRPTLGPTVDQNADTYRQQLGQGAKRVLDGSLSGVDVMDLVVQGVAGDVKTAISQLTSPPLKPETIRRKGFNKPLVHSGQMLQSVTGKAERVK